MMIKLIYNKMDEKKYFSLVICLALVAVLGFFSCERVKGQKINVIKDVDKVSDIDNNIYKIRVLGKQLWMAENLKVTRFKNGDLIDNVQESKKWIVLNKAAWVYYDNDNKSYDDIYGKLYNWYVVKDTRGVCPEGWRIPKTADWEVLLKQLKMVFDPVGLAMIPGGFRSGKTGTFQYSGDDGYLWVDEKDSIVYGWNRDMPPNGAGMYRQVVPGTNGYSIRCMKDK